MKRKKIVKKEVSEFNTSSMSKPRKILYNKIIKNYRFSEIYDFLKFIYINEVNFSDIFMRDLFYFLIKVNQYSSQIMYEYDYTYFTKQYDFSLTNSVIPLNSMSCNILEAVVAKKYSLPIFELEKLIFASLIIFLKSKYYNIQTRFPRYIGLI